MIQVAKGGLTEDLIGLPRWRSDRAFNAIEWSKYGEVADLFRKATQEQRLNAIKDCWEVHKMQKADDFSEPASVLYVFLRFVYEVENKQGKSVLGNSKGWIGKPLGDVLWPFSLEEKGKLKLVALYKGSRGAPFDAVQEFKFISSEFPLRDSNPTLIIGDNISRSQTK